MVKKKVMSISEGRYDNILNSIWTLYQSYAIKKLKIHLSHFQQKSERSGYEIWIQQNLKKVWYIPSVLYDADRQKKIKNFLRCKTTELKKNQMFFQKQ